MAANTGRLIGGISFGVSMDTRKLRKNIVSTRRMIGGFVRGVSGMGAALGAAGLGAAVLAAGRSFESLNKSMNRSLAIMGDVSNMMRGEMRQAAIDVSATTVFSASQAADAYFFLASAGLNAEQSLAALPRVAKFAQAGNFDMALATDLLTDAQSALGLTVDDTSKNMENMSKVSDVLVKANTLANATVQQFSESLTNKAGAGLRLVNKDIEEGIAVLSVYADQGIKGAEAGTALGIVLRDLQTKAIKFKSAFKGANVSVFDAAGNMRNMADIVGDLEDKLFGMSDQMKKTTLLNLGFSDKSVAFVQALLGTSDAIREYEKNLRSAGGITGEVAGKQMTDLEKAMNKLAASWQQLAESMAPAVDMAAKFATSVAELSKGATLTDGVFGVNDIGARQTAAGPKFQQYRQVQTDQVVARRKLGEATQIAAGVYKFLASGKAITGVRNAIASKKQSNRGQFEGTGLAGALKFLGEVPGKARSAALAGIGKLQFGLMEAQIAGAKFSAAQTLANKDKTRERGRLSFAESGSAASFNQRADNRRIRENQKLDIRRNSKLDRLIENTANNNIVQVSIS